MIQLTQSPRSYLRTGLWIFIAELSLYVCTLPPLRFGLWPRIETTELWFLLLAAANGGWLWWGLSKNWLKLSWPAHPLWWCLLAWVAWQTLPTLMAMSPWRAWFGHPMHGIGMAWYVASLFSLFLAYVLWQLPEYRRGIMQVAVLGIAILTALHLANQDSIDRSWLPGQWMNYVTYMFGWLWIALLSYQPVPKLRSMGWLIVSGLLLLLASNNSTSMVLLSYAIILTSLTLWTTAGGMPFFTHVGKGWRTLAIIACLLPIVWLPLGFFAHSIPNFYHSLVMRSELVEAGLTALADHPLRLLFGSGWGHFTDDIFTYAMTPGVHSYKNGELDPNSVGVLNDVFHSHCQPLEALMALGLPGILLWLALPVLIVRAIPAALFWRVVPMLVALNAMSYFWFLLPQVMAYQAFFLAAMLTVCESDKPSRPLEAKWPALLILAVSMLMLWSAWQQQKAMHYGETLGRAAMTEPYKAANQEFLLEDISRGGDRLTALIANVANAYFYRDQGSAKDNDRGWMTRFLHAAEVMANSPRIGVHSASMELWLQHALLVKLTSKAYEPLRHEALNFLPAAVARAAVRTPSREDTVAFYLLWLEFSTKNDIPRRVEMLNHLLALNPDHRSALWLLGKTFAATDGYEIQGKNLMKRAALLGVDRVYPVTDAEIAAILKK